MQLMDTHLTHKVPPIICSRRQIQKFSDISNFSVFSKITEIKMLADDSHEISYLIFFRKLGKMSQNLSSAAVVIGALRVLMYVAVCKTVL